jgi:hypothetical protein
MRVTDEVVLAAREIVRKEGLFVIYTSVQLYKAIPKRVDLMKTAMLLGFSQIMVHLT